MELSLFLLHSSKLRFVAVRRDRQQVALLYANCDSRRLHVSLALLFSLRIAQLAGLWWGGGKGVIPRVPSDRRALEDPGFRKAMFEDYGEFLTSLNGSYVCAEDVGLNVEVRACMLLCASVGGGNLRHNT